MNKKVLVLINRRNFLYQNARDRRILQAMLRLRAHFARLACVGLEWGDQTKPGGDGFIVATLVMWFVLTITFIVAEWLQGSRAMVPLSLLKCRMTWTSAWIHLQ